LNYYSKKNKQKFAVFLRIVMAAITCVMCWVVVILMKDLYVDQKTHELRASTDRGVVFCVEEGQRLEVLL